MGFDYQPVLKGTLLTLRPLHSDDRDALWDVARDPLIWAQHPVPNRHDESVFQHFFDEALSCGGTLVAVDAADGRIVGSSRFHGHDPARGEVEIGWTFLARSHWGGRYNGEMKRLMCAHAFGFVETVVLMIGTGNVRSQRAAERIGAVRTGTAADSAGRPSYLYRITRPPPTGSGSGPEDG